MGRLFEQGGADPFVKLEHDLQHEPGGYVFPDESGKLPLIVAQTLADRGYPIRVERLEFDEVNPLLDRAQYKGFLTHQSGELVEPGHVRRVVIDPDLESKIEHPIVPGSILDPKATRRLGTHAIRLVAAAANGDLPLIMSLLNDPFKPGTAWRASIANRFTWAEEYEDRDTTTFGEGTYNNLLLRAFVTGLKRVQAGKESGSANWSLKDDQNVSLFAVLADRVEATALSVMEQSQIVADYITLAEQVPEFAALRRPPLIL